MCIRDSIDKVAQTLSGTGTGCTPNLSMGYYDGNTVTALWNYAQHYSMSDNFFATTFGTTVMGHLNLISGQTNGVEDTINPGSSVVADGNGGLTDVGDADPVGDVCSSTTKAIHMSGQNVGDLLNAAGVTWGWFYGCLLYTSRCV